MRRREFSVLFGSALVVSAQAQTARPKLAKKIGVLSATNSRGFEAYSEAFQVGLRKQGYTDGDNLTTLYEWANESRDHLTDSAKTLINSGVSIISAWGGTASSRAVRDLSQTMPLVFVFGADPVRAGFATSLSKAIGPTTGFTLSNVETDAKRFELLTELVPESKRVAVLINPTNQNADDKRIEIRRAAEKRSVQLLEIDAANEQDLYGLSARLAALQPDALVIATDPLFTSARQILGRIVDGSNVPSIYAEIEFVKSGGLISYGPDFSHLYRMAGEYVGRLLNGERAEDMPIQQPTLFNLVINLRAARRLNVAIPQSILARADEVIE